MVSAYQIVEKYHISYQTLNYYTNMGLLSVVKKEKNQRWYKEEEVQQNLKKIVQLKDEGYPLRLICRLLNGTHNGTSAGESRKRIWVKS